MPHSQLYKVNTANYIFIIDSFLKNSEKQDRRLLYISVILKHMWW
jgi:hypothetical protein